jgi:hypothetical protein
MTDFPNYDAEQHAAIAKAYLEAALTLSLAQREKGPILFRPTLSLAGHGLELMLKACCLLNNYSPARKGGKGHDVISLWRAEVCEPVRGHVILNASRVAEEDRASGKYQDVPTPEEVSPLITEYVEALGKLHGAVGEYPLRYPSRADLTAPRSPFLVRSLRETADDLIKRPLEFERKRFRGQG